MALHWKRVSSDTKFRLGIIPLSYPRDPNKSTRRFLSNCYRSSKNDKAAITDTEEKYSELLSKHEKLQLDLDACNSKKESMLAELVSKCVLVINEKKGKVRKLQEKLSVYEKEFNQNKRTTCSSDKSLSTKDRSVQVGSTKSVVSTVDDDDEDAMLFRSRKRAKHKMNIPKSPLKDPDTLRYSKQQRFSCRTSSSVNNTTSGIAKDEYSQDTVEDANALLDQI